MLQWLERANVRSQRMLRMLPASIHQRKAMRQKSFDIPFAFRRLQLILRIVKGKQSFRRDSLICELSDDLTQIDLHSNLHS
jgi:hypothetical protein